MHNAGLKHATSERSPRRFLGWVFGLGIALTTAGINSAWGQQSTWKGAGGTLGQSQDVEGPCELGQRAAGWWCRRVYAQLHRPKQCFRVQ